MRAGCWTWGVCGLLWAVAAGAQPEAWETARQQGRFFPLLPAPALVRIEGDLGEWSGHPALLLALAQQTGFSEGWSGRRDAGGKLYLAQDEDFLYAAVLTADDRRIADPGQVFTEGDYWEFRWQGWALRVRLTTAETPEAQAEGSPLPLPPGFLLAGRALTGGYTLEWRIPWTELNALGVERAPDRPLPFDVLYVDRDGAPAADSVVQWSAAPPDWVNPTYLLATPSLETANLPLFAGALLTASPRRNYYLEDEWAEIDALCGLPPRLQSLPLLLRVMDAEGRELSARLGQRWRSSLPVQGGETADLYGYSWRWRTPRPMPQAFLVQAEWRSPQQTGLGTSATLLVSAGDRFGRLRARLEGLRQTIALVEEHPRDEQAEAVRRFAPSLLIQLQNLGNLHDQLPSWSVRSSLAEFEAGLEEAEARWRQVLRGENPFASVRDRSLLMAYRSPIDGQLWPYSIHVPREYGIEPPQQRGADPTQKPLQQDSSVQPWPLLVTLSGYGGSRFGSASPHEGFLTVAIGRPDGDYKLWFEYDIRRVIEEVRQLWRVDPDRICLHGGSMGGTGTWQIGTRYPDLFAALGPVCGNSNHRVWEEVWGWGQQAPTFMTPMRDFLEETEDAVQFADNLANLPAYFVHGTADEIVPVGHSRSMEERLKALGYPHRYLELPGVGHSVSTSDYDRVKEWLWRQRRDPYPRRVVFRTAWLRHPGAYWVEILRFRQWLRFARIEAQGEGNRFAVKTDNVARFALDLHLPWVDAQQPVTVEIDGQPAYGGILPADRRLVFEQQASQWGVKRPETAEKPESAAGAVDSSLITHHSSPLEKTKDLCGPIEHAFMGPYLLVYGTQSPDARENEVSRAMAEEFAERWKRWSLGPPRLKADVEVTEDDVGRYHLILYGNPRVNRWTARINDRLPIRFQGEAVALGDRRFAGKEVGVKLIYPNPLNPNRYVCVFAGVGWQATHGINGRFGNWFDWGILDNRNWFDFGIFDDRTHSPETFLAVGFFDQDWRLNRELTFIGSPADRLRSVPRRVPALQAADLTPNRCREVYLSELAPAAWRMEKGTPAFDQSFNGYPLKLGERWFQRGLGVRPHAELVYHLAGRFLTFEAWVGVDLEGARSVSPARADAERVEFEVYGDGKLLARTGVMRWNSSPRHLYLSVKGVRELKLVAAARDGRKWLFGAADWGLARLVGPAVARAETSCPRGHEEMPLDGRWSLQGLEVGIGAQNELYRPTDRLPQWLWMQVPGTVQAALMEQGELPDLNRGAHFAQTDAVNRQEWWLRRWVRVPAEWQGQPVQLRMGGAGYQADFWVNGEFVGSVQGAYQPAALEVGPWLRFGEPNFLAIRLVAAPAAWTFPDSFRLLRWGEGLLPAIRQGAGGFPNHPVLELQAISLKTSGPMRFSSPPQVRAIWDIRSNAPPNSVVVRVEVSVENLGAGPLEAEVKVEVTPATAAPGTTSSLPRQQEHQQRSSCLVKLAPGQTRVVTLEVPIPAAKIWPGLEPGNALYRVRVGTSLRNADRVSDRWEVTIGLRRVEQDGEGRSWLVNGRPLRLWGAVWLPLHLWRMPDPETVEQRLALLRRAGFNAVRVWAGGGLESDAFYDACDRLGLWVIQEWPLLGPDEWSMPLPEWETAVRSQLLRLRHHPCLLAWLVGRDLTLGQELTRQRVEALQALCRELDPDRPCIAPLRSESGESWPLAEPEALLEVREVQLPAAPAMPSQWERFLTAEERKPHSSAWQQHGATEAALRSLRPYGPLATEAQWASVPFLAQQWAADGARDLMVGASLAVSDPALRSAPGAVSEAPAGVFVWAWNDPWPAFGSGLLDAFGHPRPVLSRLIEPDPPFLWPQIAKQEWQGGETLEVQVVGVGPPLRGPLLDTAWKVRLQILGLPDGRQRALFERPLAAPPQAQLRTWATFRWPVPPYEEEGILAVRAQLVEIELPAENRARTETVRATETRWLVVRRVRATTTRLRVLWIGAPAPPDDWLEELRRRGVELTVWKPGQQGTQVKEPMETPSPLEALPQPPSEEFVRPVYPPYTPPYESYNHYPRSPYPLVVSEKASQPAAPSARSAQNSSSPLAGYDVVIIGGEDRTAPLTYDQRQAMEEEVRQGMGLLVEGLPDWLRFGGLRGLLPLSGYLVEMENGSGPVRARTAGHPLVEGWPWQELPELLARYRGDPQWGNALLDFDDGHPLLREGRAGRGRVLLFTLPSTSLKQFRSWQPAPNLYACWLAYLAGWTYSEIQSLREGFPTSPWHALGELPQATLAWSVPALPTLKGGEDSEWTIEVSNTGTVPALWAMVELVGLPRAVELEPAVQAFALWPGETRTVSLRLRLGGLAAGRVPVRVRLSGWNVATQERTAELRMEPGS